MKITKNILFILIIFVLLVISTLNVYANETTKLGIASSADKIQKDKQLTVTLSINSVDETKGINAISGKLVFDTKILSYVNSKSLNNWGNVEINTDTNSSNFGTFVIENSNDIKEKSDIVQFTFDVIDDTKESTTISVDDIKAVLGEDEVTVDNVQLTLKSESGSGNGNESGTPSEGKVTLTKIEISKKAKKLEYTEGEKFDISEMVIKATYSDNTTKDITEFEISPDDELTIEDKEIIITYTEGGITKTVKQEIKVNAKKLENETLEAEGNNDTLDENNNGKIESEGNISDQKNDTNSIKTETSNKSNETNKNLPKAGKEGILVFIMLLIILSIVVNIIYLRKYNKI